MKLHSVVFVIVVISTLAMAVEPEIIPSEGFELFDHWTTNVDPRSPDAGSVTMYAESNQNKVVTRIWIQNDSDHWISVSWVKVCILLSLSNCLQLNPNGDSIVCLRHTDATTCGGKDYYVPPRETRKWQLNRQVWLGPGYREPKYVKFHVQWSRISSTPQDRTAPQSCLCNQ